MCLYVPQTRVNEKDVWLMDEWFHPSRSRHAKWCHEASVPGPHIYQWVKVGHAQSMLSMLTFTSDVKVAHMNFGGGHRSNHVIRAVQWTWSSARYKAGRIVRSYRRRHQRTQLETAAQPYKASCESWVLHQQKDTVMGQPAGIDG